jgi:hypothetical protein
MTHLRFLPSLSLFVAVLASSVSAAPAPELPVEHFFRNPAITQLRFSPNGRYIAALVPHERRLNLVVMDVEKKSKNLITAFKDFSISSFRWANDDRLVMLLDDDGDEDFLPFAIDRDGKNFTKFDDTKGSPNWFVAIRRTHGGCSFTLTKRTAIGSIRAGWT